MLENCCRQAALLNMQIALTFYVKHAMYWQP